MYAMRSRSRTMQCAWFLAAWALAVAGLPAVASADRDDDGWKHRREHHRRHRDECAVRVVEVVRPACPAPRVVEVVRPARPARVVVGFHFGGPVVLEPVRYSCAARPPVYYYYYYAPPACAAAPVIQGPYYDPYCESRFASFELYLEHVNRNHGVSVRVRN